MTQPNDLDLTPVKRKRREALDPGDRYQAMVVWAGITSSADRSFPSASWP